MDLISGFHVQQKISMALFSKAKMSDSSKDCGVEVLCLMELFTNNRPHDKF